MKAHLERKKSKKLERVEDEKGFYFEGDSKMRRLILTIVTFALMFSPAVWAAGQDPVVIPYTEGPVSSLYGPVANGYCDPMWFHHEWHPIYDRYEATYTCMDPVTKAENPDRSGIFTFDVGVGSTVVTGADWIPVDLDYLPEVEWQDRVPWYYGAVPLEVCGGGTEGGTQESLDWGCNDADSATSGCWFGYYPWQTITTMSRTLEGVSMIGCTYDCMFAGVSHYQCERYPDPPGDPCAVSGPPSPTCCATSNPPSACNQNSDCPGDGCPMCYPCG